MFYVSSGWLYRWKSHYSIRQLTVSGQQSFSDKIGPTEFKEKFKKITGMCLKDLIYNGDETGLNKNDQLSTNVFTVAVSYTHLDVYKRQVTMFILISCWFGYILSNYCTRTIYIIVNGLHEIFNVSFWRFGLKFKEIVYKEIF